MKTLLSILFLFVCAFAHAQYHNVEGIRFVGRSDSTTISNVGQIQFDADDDKFRFNDGTGWYSYIKEGATLPYWPLTGSVFGTGATSITYSNDDSFLIGYFAESSAFSGFTMGVDGTDLTDVALWYVSDATQSNWGGVTFADDRVRIGAGDITEQDFESYIDFLFTGEIRVGQEILNTNEFTGILYPDGYDSTKWLPETLVTKGYVDGSIEDFGSDFWPLTGTASLTGATTINGGGTNDLSFGASASRLDQLSVYADNSVSFNVASGNNLNTATLTSNSYDLIMYDTDGETIDVEITISTGTSDIINIAKDGSLVFSIDENGHIRYVNPPTDCTGLDANTIWSDGGTLKLCP